MLAQTTVAAVVPYYTRWFKEYPDIRSLARAPVRQVLKSWQGLGYYERARNLLRTAKAIVRDHGPGVPVADRDKIFEPFFTTAVHGLGMGLFVASRIADLQNIQLSLLHDPGGAAFRVGLPLA